MAEFSHFCPLITSISSTSLSIHILIVLHDTLSLVTLQETIILGHN